MGRLTIYGIYRPLQMDNTPFFTIDGNKITLTETLRYLRYAGGFQRFMKDILRQYILEKEIESQQNSEVPYSQITKAIAEFQEQANFKDRNQFSSWMNANGLTYKEFEEQVAFGIKVEKLKAQIIAEKLEEVFANRKGELDRVVLSRIILKEQKEADKIQQKILEDSSNFELLAREYSITEDRLAGGMMGPVRMGALGEPLKSAVYQANVGDLIGPVEIEGRYCLFLVGEKLPAVLEGALKQELGNQIFEEWLQEKLAKLQVKLEVALQDKVKD
ncbi:peptidylprolyl isomerase [Ancylothrix sp. C2]|uniref:peptidylprolyl isomerase n=1 Tax=Ancylothrix sp. D3o TaxID=2953691 RepID=UPI0021BB6DF9|nr:peptidylprolyl isomerase [Ancylothrix sp. D3o]MCT7952730.1 peptidylprolyl isomerase [Ancylothrix sp. D3o]